MTSGLHASGRVDDRTEVVATALLGLTQVHTDPHP
jgi:hypothetical protein